MASGTRGRLKEHVVGIHRNCEWIQTHCIDCVKLLGDGYEDHRKSFELLHELAVTIDEFASSLHNKL